MNPSPITIDVYDAAGYLLAPIGDPVSVQAVPRHNAVSTATVTVKDSARADLLAADGARATLTLDGLSGILVGGYVTEANSDITGTRVFTVVDDWTLLLDTLGWPVPGSPLTAQTLAYDIRSGPAETVVKQVVQANAVDRIGRAVTVAPDLGRGAQVTCSFRMHPLADRLFPAADQAGIGVTVRAAPPVLSTDGRPRSPGLIVDCYTPRVFGSQVSDISGAVETWKHHQQGPTVTRVVSGAQGEAAARDFGSTTDSPLELRYGRVVERFIDARDTADQPVALNRRAEALAAGAPSSGVAVTLAQTGGFVLGDRGVRVGDLLPVRVGGFVFLDVLREATVTWQAGSGLQITPTIGDVQAPHLALPGAITDLRRTVRDLTAGR